MNKESKKAIILKYEKLLSLIYRFIGRNKIHVSKGNRLELGNVFMKGCTINISGQNNLVKIESGLTRLTNSKLFISGNNCKLLIGASCNLKRSELLVEDDNGSIIIGKHVTIHGPIHLSVIEGTTISIGEDCLISSSISFSTGDSHSVIDKSTGLRINPSADIKIGDHVWIGQGVRILKGVTIGDHSIVALGALITSNDYPANSVIGGIGGKVLKTGIDWLAERI